MTSAARHRQLAAESWESLFRTQVAVIRQLSRDPAFKTVSMREYDVLFTLSGCPTGWIRLNELNDQVLLTQPSISRMVERLEKRGLIRRKTADGDRRGVLIGLTEAGLAMQKDIGRSHVQNIMQLMESGLTDAEMATLLELTGKLHASVTDSSKK